MNSADRLPTADLPDSPQARQLREGFPWLTFDPQLEPEFRRAHFEENLPHTRVNLCLAVLITIAFSAMESMVLGPGLNRIPSMIHMLVIIPTLLIGLASSFSPQRHRFYPLLMMIAATVLGLGVAAIQIIGTLGGVPILFPCLMLTVIFIYFMGGLIFYHAVAANVTVMLVYLAAGTELQLPGREFGYDALAMIAANLFGASVVYMHEKTSRMRFLEACLLREMVARDGLTGIQNRRMFDQHIERVWHQAVREEERVAVLLVDVDCFKDYNDRYGHQAGDECLRAVAVSLSQCARRPLDFVARYGGEEFAVVLYEASREYVAEVLTRIQRSIAELNIPHEASRVASRLTVSIGAAYILPTSSRTPDGLIQLADEALYTAKEQGRNQVVVMEAEYHTLRTGRFEKRRGQRGA
ncbi:MAG TPA: diguanylate cyclase [Steroidobacteraceae bacterium]|jgi:diguanylate cyclase (GGDEF)-like protein|nr:diguanylate cyclase [Steroidobacteraceae bacterium]